MLPLNTHACVEGASGTAIFKVLRQEEAEASCFDPTKCLIWRDQNCDGPFDPWAGTIAAPGVAPDLTGVEGVHISNAKNPDVVSPGDVIRVEENSSRVSVLFRRGSNSNTLLATNRCNSFCLMCSQPPRPEEDQWLVDEMLETIPLVDRDEPQLGISGGEPTLLGDDLVAVLHQAKTCLPNTGVHVLSNGRNFSDPSFARIMSSVRHPALTWGIPVYSDSPEVHDYIVQSRGAWIETMDGLYNLARNDASIEIRVVVQRGNFERLGELARFIFRNLTFVDHVAFMGLEPMGFAKFNREEIWVDPSDCGPALSDAVFYLANRGMNVSIYNFPLCTLPEEVWPFCERSISDWKNRYQPICHGCEVRNECCGFFASVSEEWISRNVKPVRRRMNDANSLEVMEAIK